MHRIVATLYYAVFIGKVLTRLTESTGRFVGNNGKQVPFEVWFGEGREPDLAKRAYNMAVILAEKLDIYDLSVPDVCKIIIDKELEGYIVAVANEKEDAPTDRDICKFIQDSVWTLNTSLVTQ